MTNEILTVNGVELRQIDTDFGKQKRAARRIPSPLGDMMENVLEKRENTCKFVV